MSDTIFLIFELMGTVAFAVSGAMNALQKKMDIFGVSILGLTTAVGGGVIRDLLLGLTPPMMFRNPLYALLSVAVAIIIFIPAIRRFLGRKPLVQEKTLLLMDSIGLGIFTVTGIATAMEHSEKPSLLLLLFVGTLTGVGGGVLRDMMAGQTPYIFVKHFYATASLVGALLCIGLWNIIGQTGAMLCGTAMVVVLRLLAAHFRWSLPKANE